MAKPGQLPVKSKMSVHQNCRQRTEKKHNSKNVRMQWPNTPENTRLFMSSVQRKDSFMEKNCAYCPGDRAGAISLGKLKVTPGSCLFRKHLPLASSPIPVGNS